MKLFDRIKKHEPAPMRLLTKLSDIITSPDDPRLVSTRPAPVSTKARKADRHKDPAAHREKSAQRMRDSRAKAKGTK